MQAFVCHALNEPPRLHPDWPEPPDPGPGELMVAVAAAALNHPDLLMLTGGYQYRPPLPFVPGSEAAGRVIATGTGAEAWAGRRVIVGTRSGCLAERLTVPVRAVRAAPEALTDAEAAAFTVGALTAWVGLVQRGRLQRGERVLVTGAGGGMGLAAVALAARLGAEVTALASSPERLALAAAAGTHHLLQRDRSAPAIAATGFDLVFDTLGGGITAAALGCLARGGRYLVIGFVDGGPARVALDRLQASEIEIIGVRAGEQGRQDPASAAAALQAIDARAGTLRPAIGLQVPLAEASRAFAAMAAGTLAGKAVVLMPEFRL